eukprot:scaffold488615_cov19-Prasinocladus_malaysianus.AAC.1
MIINSWTSGIPRLEKMQNMNAMGHLHDGSVMHIRQDVPSHYNLKLAGNNYCCCRRVVVLE